MLGQAVSRTKKSRPSPAPVRQEVEFRVGLGVGFPSKCGLVALDLARSGREPDLVQAIAACEEGMRQKPEDTTASARVSLTQTAHLMRLRLARVQRGHEVRHHPGPAARRNRELRFA